MYKAAITSPNSMNHPSPAHTFCMGGHYMTNQILKHNYKLNIVFFWVGCQHIVDNRILRTA